MYPPAGPWYQRRIEMSPMEPETTNCLGVRSVSSDRTVAQFSQVFNKHRICNFLNSSSARTADLEKLPPSFSSHVKCKSRALNMRTATWRHVAFLILSHQGFRYSKRNLKCIQHQSFMQPWSNTNRFHKI